MFTLLSFDEGVVDWFDEGRMHWQDCVRYAIYTGVLDLDKLTDLAFYMLHPEMMDGLIGRPLTRDHPEFDSLAEHWQDLRIVMPDALREAIAFAGPPPRAPEAKDEDDWSVPESIVPVVQKIGGKKAVRWLKEPPRKDREVIEFLPHPSARDHYEAVLLWKSKTPERLCIAAPDGIVQAVLLVRCDTEYWQNRPGISKRAARIKSISQTISNRDYRQYIIEEKQCPASARLRARELSRTLTLMQAQALYAIMPFPGKVGNPVVDDAAKLLAEAAKLLEKIWGD